MSSDITEITGVLGRAKELMDSVPVHELDPDVADDLRLIAESAGRSAMRLSAGIQNTVPKGLYVTDLVSYARETDPSVVTQENVTLLGDNDTAFNATLEFVVDRYGQLFQPESLLDYLANCGIGVGEYNKAVPSVLRLLKKWQDELEGFLNEEGLFGGWSISSEGITYAPYAHSIEQTTQPGVKEDTTGKSKSDLVDEQVTSVGGTEITQDNLTPREKNLMTAMTNLSLREEEDYPTKDKVINGIAVGSKMSSDDAESLVNGLVERGYLFNYRHRGKNYVTTNSNVAFEFGRRAKKYVKNETEPTKELQVDAELANDLIRVLKSIGEPEQKHTIQSIWAGLQEYKGIIVHHETPTKDEEKSIKKIAQLLVKLKVLFAGEYKAQTSGARHSARRTTFKIGFASREQYDKFRDSDESQWTIYIKSLVDEYNEAKKS